MERAYQRALDAAARQLSYRALSAAALRDKLTGKGHEEDAVDYAVAWLTERGLLSDDQFAEETVRAYERRGYGAARIRQELHRRGVDRETAEQAMADFSPDMARLRALLDKRLRGDLSDRREVDKAVAFLQRRGFRWDEIRQALREYGAQLDEDFD